MATLYVENVPDELYEALRSQARQNRRSIAAETIHILEDAVPTRAELRRRLKWLREVDRIRNESRWEPGPTVEQMIREDRDR